MLTDAQKADIRRHLRFGPFGTTQTPQGSMAGYRFLVTQGLLEYRMNVLSAVEEQILIGTGSQTSPINPNFTHPSTGVVYDGYLPIVNYLEGQIAASTDNLDTDQAGDWHARKEEIQQRAALYNYWCTRMAQYLYLPMGRPLAGSSAAMAN